MQRSAVGDDREEVEAAGELLVITRNVVRPVLVEWIQQERDSEIQPPEQSQCLEDTVTIAVIARDGRCRRKDDNRPGRQLIDHRLP